MNGGQVPCLPLSFLAHPSDRRSRRSAELRERLFRAALTLFAKKGFAETTVEDITNAADVGKGTFFNYFPSKDHILLAFSEMQLAKLQSAVDEARRTSTPMPDFLRSLGQRMTEEPTRNPEIIRALLLAYISSNTPVREAMLDLQNPCSRSPLGNDCARPEARRNPRRPSGNRNRAGFSSSHFRHALDVVSLWRLELVVAHGIGL